MRFILFKGILWRVYSRYTFIHFYACVDRRVSHTHVVNIAGSGVLDNMLSDGYVVTYCGMGECAYTMKWYGCEYFCVQPII